MPPPRSSIFLAEELALNLLNAFDFAAATGDPLNTAVTLSFPGCRFYRSGEANSANTTACRNAMMTVLRDFAGANGFDAKFVYVLENPATGGYGLNAHILCHLPARNHAALRVGLQAALEEAFDWLPRTGLFVPVYIDENCFGPRSAFQCLHYLLKGLDPKAAEDAFLNQDFTQDNKPQGTIHGRRAGPSKNLNRGARREAGHMDVATSADFDVRTSPMVIRQDKALLAEVHAGLRRAAFNHSQALAV